MTELSPALIWVLIAIAAGGTWLLRLSFIALLGRVSTVPAAAMRLLRLIPAAVMAAIVAPSLTHSAGEFDLTTARFAAGVIAALVAWRTKHVLATITAGMGSLWILQALA
jgi:branched-subunit amino acid transport protein